jgi:hypothetical protein
MYSVRWGNGSPTAILEYKHLAIFINLLEKLKIKYKVADVAGFKISQKQFGWGGYLYWMEENEIFSG